MHASHFCDSKTSLNTWGSWKPNIHCYKPSAVETMTLLQTLGRRIQQHCCKPSAVEPRHCYGFSAMIPFCGTFPKDSKSTALGLLGNVVLFCFLSRQRNLLFCLIGMFAFGCWAGIKMFLREKGACQNDMKTVSLQFHGFA